MQLLKTKLVSNKTSNTHLTKVTGLHLKLIQISAWIRNSVQVAIINNYSCPQEKIINVIILIADILLINPLMVDWGNN